MSPTEPAAGDPLSTLRTERLKLLRELEHLEAKIVSEEGQLAQLEERLAHLSWTAGKAA